MTANINPETRIAYGYISANALDDDIVNELQSGTDVYYKEAKIEAAQGFARDADVRRQMAEDQGLTLSDHNEDDLYRMTLQWLRDNWEGSMWETQFNDDWQPDEPVHEGTITLFSGEKVEYRTSWLGGALNVWILESPHITYKARRASPCVPNAGILDTLDGDVTAYNVPADWRSVINLKQLLYTYK